MNGIKRIVVIGPESTGKSTLSAALAQSLHTNWVPEYARTYLDSLRRPYGYKDLLCMARGQQQQEKDLAATASRFLICDTDLQVIRVWSEHRYQNCHLSILQSLATTHTDLYLLTDIDFPWQPDPQREHPQPHMRRYFFNVYKSIVMESKRPFALLSGNAEQRLHAALAAILNLQE